MQSELDIYITSITNFNSLKPAEKCDYFAYYLSEIDKRAVITAKDIESCFSKLKIAKYSNISYYLSRNSIKTGKKTQKFIRTKQGFILERNHKISLEENIVLNIPHINVSQSLRSLLPLVQEKSSRDFLEEAIKSFEVSAYRASIIITWLLTIDVLYEFIIKNRLVDFNAELGKVTDKRVKVQRVVIKDDFSDIPENKFIEICRASNIISNDIRKILDVKLGIRNSAAHPSNIVFGKGKVFEFIEDLINNIIIKFV